MKYKRMLWQLNRLLMAGSMLALVACSTAPKKPATVELGDYSYAKEYLAWLMDKEMKKRHVTGAAIALVDDQGVVWSQGFGYGDAAGQIAATPETLFRVGSISKLFTAMAVLKLAEQGQLDIDAPVEHYLPSFSMKAHNGEREPITLRALMTHHAGLQDNYHQGMWANDPAPFTQMLEMVKEEHVTSPPNRVFAYSNVGYTLLGHVVQEVSGRPFEQYVDEELLRPMGISKSSFAMNEEVAALASKGYKDGEEVAVLPLRDIPAGNLQASVNDLAKFMKMVFAQGHSDEQQVIKPETLAEMLTPQNDNVALDFDMKIGLSWFISDKLVEGGGPVVSHGGGTLLFHSQLMTLPAHKLGVVVVSNTPSGRGLVDKVAVEALKLALEVKTGIRQPEEREDLALPAIAGVPEALPYELSGRYMSEVGEIEIVASGDRYHADALGRRLSLKPRQGGWFTPHYKLFGFIPIGIDELENVMVKPAIVDGHKILIARTREGEFLLGSKIERRPIAESWRSWLGPLHILNPDRWLAFEDLTLEEDDGYLVISYRLPFFFKETRRVILQPVSESEAIIAGLGTGMGATVRLQEIDGESRMVSSGYEIVPNPRK